MPDSVAAIARSRVIIQCAGAVIAGCLLSNCGGHERISGANWAGPLETRKGQEFTPERMIRRQISGWVLLSCVAGEDHSAQNCKVVGEYPLGQQLGAAALRMQSSLKANVAEELGDRRPQAGERFFFPLKFCQPQREAECEQMQVSVDAYRQQLIEISELVHAHRCDDARAAAADTEQPAIMRLVASCAKTTSITN